MSQITLNYFDGRARAELARLVFAAGGIQYNDNRFVYEEWPNHKPNAPLGQVPYLQVDDVKIPQSIAIARYAAKVAKLAGRDDLEQAKADAVVDTCNDIMNNYYPKVYRAENKDEAYAKFLEVDASHGLSQLEKLITIYGQNGYSVGDSLTWADLFIYEVCSQLMKDNDDYLNKYQLVQKVRALVMANERISEYIKNRKPTPF